MNPEAFPNIISTAPFMMDHVDRSLRPHGANNQSHLPKLRIALNYRPGYVEKCVFEKPPCPDCMSYDQCGGFDYKFLTHAVAPTLNRSPVFVEAKDYSLTFSNQTVLDKLLNGEADISQSYITFAPKRSALLSNSFPVFYSRYVAIIKKPMHTSQDLAINVWTGLIMLSLFLLIYVLTTLIVTKEDQICKVPIIKGFLKVPNLLFWVVIAVSLSYITSTVALRLNAEPSVKLPFQTFKELAMAFKQHRLKPIVLYNITRKKIFDQPEARKGSILSYYHEAYKVNPPLVLNMHDAVEKLLESEQNVLLVTDHADITIIQQSYCGLVMQVRDSEGELPMEFHGFYYGSNFHYRMDWYQRHVLASAYYAWLRYYTWNTTNACGLEMDYPREPGPLTFKQIKTVFWLLPIGWVAGMLAFMTEKTRRFVQVKRKV